MSSRLKLLCAVLCLSLLPVLWLRKNAVDTHDQMLALLEEVKNRTPIENEYLGSAALEGLNQRLAHAVTGSDRMTILWERAPLALRLGMVDEALDDLRTVQELFTELRPGLSPDACLEFEVELHFNLAVAHLRKGETENCVHCQTGESCILPIRGEGVHVHPAGSRQAVHHLQQVLQRQPGHLPAKWLLNVAHMTLGSYPDSVPSPYLIEPSKFESEASFPRLANVAAQAGLSTFGLAGGAIVDDFDGDHLLDVIVSDWNTSSELRYFRNDGDGSFSDRSHEAGFRGVFGGLNLRHADYDNDGDLDILVLRGGWLAAGALSPNSLLENDGAGVFRDVTFDVGLGDVHYPTQTADWADFDNDGFLDLFIGNEDVPSQLFKNTGQRHFIDVAARAGVENRRYAKGVTWGDYNDDGFPDLYVSNLGSSNRLYRNNRDGTFTDVATEKDVAQPTESFPAWFWDFNNDGALDLYVGAYDIRERMHSFVADFLGLPNSAEFDLLYQGDGSGNFVDVSGEKRVARVTLPMGSNFGDIDGDGFLDYYLGTGFTEYEALQPNRLFLNRAGEHFDDVSAASGMSHIQKGHGVSFADIDNDGDRDVFIVMGGAYPGDGFTNALFNNPGFDHHWITIKLVGQQTNRSGIGARIHVALNESGKRRSIYRWVTSGGSFGGNPLRQEIGIGVSSQIEFIEVTWPTSRKSQRFENVGVDQFIEITEGQSEYRRLDVPSFSLPSGDRSPR